jgi:protein phosphatase
MILRNASLTDRGLNPNRLHNEDCLMVAEPLFIVADGLGGELAGEVASKMTVEKFKDYFDEATRGNGITPESELVVIERVIKKVNQVVHLESQKPEFHNMGSTLSVLYILDKTALIGHVGDSKIFLYRQGRVEQLTKDQSMVQQMIDKGVITPEQAKRHPMRNVLLSCIAHKPDIEVFCRLVNLQPDDRILLCSDGVSEYVWPDDLVQLFNENPSPEEACDIIRKKVMDGGAMDNLTAIIVAVDQI